MSNLPGPWAVYFWTIMVLGGAITIIKAPHITNVGKFKLWLVASFALGVLNTAFIVNPISGGFGAAIENIGLFMFGILVIFFVFRKSWSPPATEEQIQTVSSKINTTSWISLEELITDTGYSETVVQAALSNLINQRKVKFHMTASSVEYQKIN